MNISEIQLKLQALAMFRELLKDEVVASMLDFLVEADAKNKRFLYCNFVHNLYKKGGDLGNHLLAQLGNLQTVAIDFKIKKIEMPEPMQANLLQELDFLSALSAAIPAIFTEKQLDSKALPSWENTPHDFKTNYLEMLDDVFVKGFGVFSNFHVFTVDDNAKLCAVKNPDPQRMADLTGYETERKMAQNNILALLKGQPAHNVLLYGDAGTGKSSTVKALANLYKSEGLRLVELQANQLHLLSAVMQSLEDNPLKFILFVDDISFLAEDKGFNILKAALEGRVTARPANIVVYATSNRRHLVRQGQSDRYGDDLHLADTLQEQASLAERFGLTITFLKPDKDLYAEIVGAYVKKLGLETELSEILKKAEAFALRKGGRSPRTARQFVEWLKSNE